MTPSVDQTSVSLSRLEELVMLLTRLSPSDRSYFHNGGGVFPAPTFDQMFEASMMALARCRKAHILATEGRTP